MMSRRSFSLTSLFVSVSNEIAFTHLTLLNHFSRLNNPRNITSGEYKTNREEIMNCNNEVYTELNGMQFLRNR